MNGDTVVGEISQCASPTALAPVESSHTGSPTANAAALVNHSVGSGSSSPSTLNYNSPPGAHVASSPLFVPSSAETRLEETADVLGVQRPEDVAILLQNEGISTWATVLAVGRDANRNGAPVVEDDPDAKEKENTEKSEFEDVPSASEVDPSEHKRPYFTRSVRSTPRLRKRGQRLSIGKRSSTASMPVKSEDEAMKRDFILKLARALTQYGAPSHRLEYHLAQVATVLKIDADFIIFPGVVMSSFGGGEKHTSSTHFVRQNQGINMGKLAQVNALCMTLTQNLITVPNALDLLEGVRAASDYPWWVGVAIFPVSSFSIALVLFQLTWLESVVAGLLGVLVGFLNLAAEKYSTLLYLLEFVSALGSAFLTRSVQAPLWGTGNCLRWMPVTLSSVALFLPGLPLTVAIIDLSSRNLVSGTVRMFGSLFTAMLLGFGMTIGSTAVFWAVDNTDSQTCGEPTSQWWAIIFFIPMSMSLNLLFQANKHQWAPMILTAALGFLTNVMLNKVDQLAHQPTVITALCGVVIGCASNLYARVTNEVAIAPILAGILLQVPGSLSVKSTLNFFARGSGGGEGGGAAANVLNGVEFTFE
ncbi:hypothetical protein HDU98_008386, partial [Podochytrium sp. JEL0797]